MYDIIANEDGMTLDVSDAKTRVDLVDVDWIFPLSWTNKGITECAFGSEEYIKGKKHIVLSVHKLNDAGNYVIKNHLLSIWYSFPLSFSFINLTSLFIRS